MSKNIFFVFTALFLAFANTVLSASETSTFLPAVKSNRRLIELPDLQVLSAAGSITLCWEDISKELLQAGQKAYEKTHTLIIIRSCTTSAACTAGSLCPLSLLSDFFPHVQVLILKNIGLTRAHLHQLVELGRFTNLKKLDISLNKVIDDKSVLEIRRASFAPTLELLDLTDTEVTAAGTQALIKIKVFKALKSIITNSHAKDPQILVLYVEDINADALQAIKVIGDTRIKILTYHKISSSDSKLIKPRPKLKPEHMYLLAKNFLRITSLSLRDTRLKPEVLRALCQPGLFTELRELDLSDNYNYRVNINNNSENYSFSAGNENFFLLTQAPFAAHLEVLNLKDTFIALRDIKLLAEANTALKTIKFRSYDYEDDTGSPGNSIVEVLLNSKFIGLLESLELSWLRLTSDGIKSLAQSDKLRAFKSLKTNSTFIGDVGLSLIATARFASTLTSLNVADSHITKDGVKVLAQSCNLVSLKKLVLAFNSIMDEGIAFLVTAPFVSQLETLNLRRVYMRQQGLDELINSDKFIALKVIDLSYNIIDSSEIKLLIVANSSKFPKLEKINA